MYVPEPPPGGDDMQANIAYVHRELQRISKSFSEGIAFTLQLQRTAPAKPREWSLYAADGVSWNPGSGKGIYVYVDGAFHLIPHS